jgi:hypothetical protein
METEHVSRRELLGVSAVTLVGAAMVGDRVQAQSIPAAPSMNKPGMQPPLYPSSGPDYQPVVTLTAGRCRGE